MHWFVIVEFRNTVLSALTQSDAAALLPHLKDVTLGAGQILCDSGDLPANVFFPSGAVVSVVTLLSDGRPFEVASIGFEGITGLLPALTGLASASRSFVQIGGGAFKLPAARLRTLADESPSFRKLILKSAQITASQAEQTVACNAYHHVSARLARWLLVTQDRVDSATLPLTQEYLAVMVGALRSSVSLSASAFRQAGLIDYYRGRLEIRDRAGLELRACECYAVDREMRSTLLPSGD